MKIITVCGSLKFQDAIMEITEKMALKGNNMLSIIYPTKSSSDDYSKEEKILFGIIHKEKIEISDAILVVNIDNYIGESTKSEINYAKFLNKEIIYYSEIKDTLN